jgi:hypothetical protein
VLLALAFLLVAACVAAAVGGMMLARRFAPPGGVFTDSDRAAGVFGVMGTSFAVLLAFVIFLAFGTYDRAKDKASVEAVAVSQLFRTARLFPSSGRRLEGELVCYGRAVVHQEWPAMRDEHASPAVEHWLNALEDTVDAVEPRDARQRIALSHWFDEASDRREGRRGRLDEATPFVPTPVWLLLGLGGLLLVVYMWFYADPAEPRAAQAVMVGAITAIVASGIVIVWFLDHPYEDVSGSLQPVAMRESLAQMAPIVARRRVVLPCAARGLAPSASAS